jgi:hypothetical protein
MVTYTAAHMRRLFGLTPHIATVASSEGDALRVHTELTAEPLDSWRSNLDEPADVYIYELPAYGPALMHGPRDDAVRAVATKIVSRYLDASDVPYEITTRSLPFGNMTRVLIEPFDQRTRVCAGDRRRESDYVPVDSVEFTGSALYAVFHTVRAVGADTIRRVQYGNGAPLRFPFPDTIPA